MSEAASEVSFALAAMRSENRMLLPTALSTLL